VRAAAICAAIAALAGVARADKPAPPDDREDDSEDEAVNDGSLHARDVAGTPSLGLRLAIGGLHVGARNVMAFSDGLQGVLALGLGFRVAGEAALLWTGGDTRVAMDEHGFGARGELGLRHKLVTWWVFYLDAEAGGGASLVRDSQSGDHTIPAWFGGLRLGYDLGGSTDNARRLEAAFDLRFYETPQGHNWMFGVSFGWGR